MADATADPDEKPKKKGILLPLIIGLVLAGAAGAGGFFAVGAGLLAGGTSDKVETADPVKVEFVPLDPLVVSIGKKADRRHLRFSAQLEVAPGKAATVQAVLPRITDVLIPARGGCGRHRRSGFAGPASGPDVATDPDRRRR